MRNLSPWKVWDIRPRYGIDLDYINSKVGHFMNYTKMNKVEPKDLVSTEKCGTVISTTTMVIGGKIFRRSTLINTLLLWVGMLTCGMKVIQLQTQMICIGIC